VGHHLVGVGAVVVALEAVEVAARLLRVARHRNCKKQGPLLEISFGSNLRTKRNVAGV
jgi:hypothetical protein